MIGGPEKRKLSLAPWTKRWEEIYAEHRERIVGVLGDVALAVHHIGSTSVPGLGAKPIVDMLLVVADVEAEGSYLPGSLGARYELRVRERGHRMVRTAERDVHVHVLSEGDSEIGEYLLFRDQLRVDESDRVLYESVKRGLLEGEWADMNDYAEAKSQVVADISGLSGCWWWVIRWRMGGVMCLVVGPSCCGFVIRGWMRFGVGCGMLLARVGWCGMW